MFSIKGSGYLFWKKISCPVSDFTQAVVLSQYVSVRFQTVNSSEKLTYRMTSLFNEAAKQTLGTNEAYVYGRIPV